MGDVQTKLLLPLTEVFGPMPADSEGLVSVYVETCKRFSDEALGKAALALAADYVPSKRHPWPAPALCVRACEKALPTKPATESDDVVARLKRRNDEAVKFARRWLTETVQGRRIDAEGWGHEAKNEVRQMYLTASRDRPVAPADIVIADARFAELSKYYGRRRGAA